MNAPRIRTLLSFSTAIAALACARAQATVSSPALDPNPVTDIACARTAVATLGFRISQQTDTSLRASLRRFGEASSDVQDELHVRMVRDTVGHQRALVRVRSYDVHRDSRGEYLTERGAPTADAVRAAGEVESACR